MKVFLADPADCRTYIYRYAHSVRLELTRSRMHSDVTLMKNRLTLLLILFLAAGCTSSPSPFAPDEVAAWKTTADGVKIIRDDWGIAHVFGKTDADAVFGMLYAQAEDDFNRIEVNFLNAMGRLSEAEGEAELYRDLRMRLFIDDADLQAMYADSPEWLKDLMDGWAGGLNYYLYTHPDVHPRVLNRFEPWMALSFSEGSIGGDIERISTDNLEGFYGKEPLQTLAGVPGNDLQTLTGVPGNHLQSISDTSDDVRLEPTGSNGFAISPKNTKNGHALLLINPHTSFYFRAEIHVVSEEGLNAYGAVTWGQFFVYQGFNEKTGWMHTSSRADNIDTYLETVVKRDDGVYYVYDGEEHPLAEKTVSISYKDGDTLKQRDFTVYRNHHGPIIGEQDGKWVAFRIMEEPLKALQQSFLRTKSKNYQDYYESMEFHTNSSNNTVYADADGTIGYFHSNFIPVRDPSYDYSGLIDGSTSATDWKGIHSIDESITIKNPPNGWIQNTNNWPFSATGTNSPKKEDYPVYMSQNPENARGLHAIRVLSGTTDFTLETLRDAAYDSYLTAFEDLIPGLLSAYDAMDPSNDLRAEVADQIQILRDWDLRFSVDSVPTSVAVFWGTELYRRVRQETRGSGIPFPRFIKERLQPELWVESLVAARDKLIADFGAWDTPWGEINRFQRLTGDIVQPFDDAGPSIPVGFTSSRWGSLAAFGQRTFNDTKKIYGTRGNSFVAVVEFGDRVRALAITAGGESGNPENPHFNDQAARYATGDLREVHFYLHDIEQAAERTYHPGE